MKHLGINKQEVFRIHTTLSAMTCLCQCLILRTIKTELGIFYPGKIKFYQSMLYRLRATRHMYLFKFKGTRLTLPVLNSHTWFVFIILDNIELLSLLSVLWNITILSAKLMIVMLLWSLFPPFLFPCIRRYEC